MCISSMLTHSETIFVHVILYFKGIFPGLFGIVQINLSVAYRDCPFTRLDVVTTYQEAPQRLPRSTTATRSDSALGPGCGNHDPVVPEPSRSPLHRENICPDAHRSMWSGACQWWSRLVQAWCRPYHTTLRMYRCRAVTVPTICPATRSGVQLEPVVDR